MTNAYHRLSLAERRKVREANRENLLYRILYLPLSHQRGGDLSPEDVWEEALKVAGDLKVREDSEGQMKEDKEMRIAEALEARMKASAVVEDLCERYSVFEDEQGIVVPRDERASQHSAMMVVATAFFMLLNEKEALEDNPNRFICKALKDAVRDVEGFQEVYEGARQEEDSLEYSGRFIKACSLLEYISTLPSVGERDISRLHEVIGLLVDETLNGNLPTIEEQERLMARVNDKTGGAISKELNYLRVSLDKKRKERTELPALDAERLASAVEEVQNSFWAQSAWAVVFCVGRDLFGGTDNASQFERQVQALAKNHQFDRKCPDGTVSRTISNNPYMKKHVGKWTGADVPERVRNLVQALKSALENTN